MLTVIITVSGGVAEVIEKPDGVSVEIRDYDIEGCDINGNPTIKTDDDGELYQEMFWE